MPFTIEDALAELRDRLADFEAAGRDPNRLLEAAKVADARHNDTPKGADQGTALARTLLIATWAHYAADDLESGGEYHPEEDFEFAAYGSAG